MSPPQHVSALLLSLFSADELGQWLARHRRLSVALPTVPAGSVAPAALVNEVVQSLSRDGLLDRDFFQLLLQERPSRKADILAVAAQLDVRLEGNLPMPAASGSTFTHSTIVRAAQRVPGATGALGVAGLSAAASVTGALALGERRVAFVVALVVLALAVVLQGSAWLVLRSSEERAARPVALGMAWAAYGLVDATLVLLLASVFLAWPLDLSSWPGAPQAGQTTVPARPQDLPSTPPSEKGAGPSAPSGAAAAPPQVAAPPASPSTGTPAAAAAPTPGAGASASKPAAAPADPPRLQLSGRAGPVLLFPAPPAPLPLGTTLVWEDDPQGIRPTCSVIASGPLQVACQAFENGVDYPSGATWTVVQ